MDEEIIAKAPIGQEQPPITPEPCQVEGYRIETISKDGKEIGPKLTLKCVHPVAGSIELSSVTYQKGNKLVTSGLWVKLDKDNRIVNPSATASMLKHYMVSCISDLKGKAVSTVLDEKGYLVVKAY